MLLEYNSKGKDTLNMVTKITLNIIGSICVALGVIGIFLPLLPTTPFLLLASACYVRGSEKLHSRLMGNRHLGPYLRNIQQKRGIPLRAKVISIAAVWASVLFSVHKVDGVVVESVLIVVGISLSILMLRMKTLRGE
jgi:uncharacterized membrane protein YbaN (DUF454 family)